MRRGDRAGVCAKPGPFRTHHEVIALTSLHPTEVSDMAKQKDKEEHHAAGTRAPWGLAGQGAGADPGPKMKRKSYEREMRVLHGELVAMQEWVKASGAKICTVFEGRDTAGKGGTIKRITERVSPSGSWSWCRGWRRRWPIRGFCC